MKIIRNWEDLKEYGIRCLTGEACGLSIRALCDLTEDGQALVREFMGLPHNTPFQESWNSGAVGSCFLPWAILPDLAGFCLLKSGFREAVHVRDDGVWGREDSDPDIEWQAWADFNSPAIVRWYRPLHGQLSQTHAMSGRAQ